MIEEQGALQWQQKSLGLPYSIGKLLHLNTLLTSVEHQWKVNVLPGLQQLPSIPNNRSLISTPSHC